MRRTEIIAAVDVGTTKVLTFVAELSPEGKVKIIGVGRSPSEGLRKGVVVDIAKTREAIEDSVARAERMATVNLDSVYVGVTGAHIQSYNTTGAVTIHSPDRPACWPCPRTGKFCMSLTAPTRWTGWMASPTPWA
jgi:cell division protein FtsA